MTLTMKDIPKDSYSNEGHPIGLLQLYITIWLQRLQKKVNFNYISTEYLQTHHLFYLTNDT